MCKVFLADFNDGICTVVSICRSNLNAGSKTKNGVDDDDPRHVDDIEKYHKNIKNIATKERIENISVAGNVKEAIKNIRMRVCNVLF